jgi:restriction endonuclease S subunit
MTGLLEKYFTGTTIKHLTGTGLKKVEIPLPPIEEQHQIVEILESKLTVCDKIEETIRQSLQQAETLKQSILKKAFEGKLKKYENGKVYIVTDEKEVEIPFEEIKKANLVFEFEDIE